MGNTRQVRGRWGLRYGVVTFSAVLLAAFSMAETPNSPPELTAKRVIGPGWWPTSRSAGRADFAGPEACAACHAQVVKTQQQTSMARAAWRAAETDVLRGTTTLSLNTPPFSTSITRDKKGSTYTVSRGAEIMSGPVLWTMGNGNLGQTFILESAGGLFDSQLSYFPAIAGLDITPGHTPSRPLDLENAFGQMQSEQTAAQCFGCHTTASSLRNRFDPTRAMPGVRCEACHGPGLRHVEAMEQGRIDAGRAAILNPAGFDPVKLVDYCGACHRTPMDVAAAKDFVPINVRFQPYRLSKSRCWSRPDARLSCIACHDPHEEVVRKASFYDAKCLACHASSGTAGATENLGEGGAVHPAAKKLAACPVASANCTSCHMPRYTVPQMHGKFTDHNIRIVRAGDQYAP